LSRRWLAFSRFFLGTAVVFAAHFSASGFASPSQPFLYSNLIYRPLFLLFLLLGFGTVVSGFDRAPGNPLAAIGLAMRRPWLRDLWIGGLLGSGMVAVAVAAIAFAGGFAITVSTASQATARAVLVVVILAAGAMAEEISFRGYPFQQLVRAVGSAPAVVILSLLFGVVHLANPDASAWGFLNTVLIGVLLALAYLRTRSLWMPIAIHFWWNITLGLVFGLPVSGLRGFSVVVHGRAMGPLWLTGGDYGLEASAVCAGVIVAGMAMLLVFVPSRKTVLVLGANESPELPVAASASENRLTLPSPEENTSRLALPPTSSDGEDFSNL
jgi:membrane protease YdiL (CAAX protease family)